jgi:Ca2+-transporting ATPase
MILIYVPFCQGVFDTQPLTIQEFLICMGLSTVVFHGIEINKMIRKGRPFKLRLFDF